jgi:hypothetical protein
VLIVEIASKTRTKLSAIKTLFTSAATLGRAPRYRAMQQLSITLQTGPTKRIPVGIAVKISPELVSLRLLLTDPKSR